jgi:hypothetical protein
LDVAANAALDNPKDRGFVPARFRPRLGVVVEKAIDETRKKFAAAPRDVVR